MGKRPRPNDDGSDGEADGGVKSVGEMTRHIKNKMRRSEVTFWFNAPRNG